MSNDYEILSQALEQIVSRQPSSLIRDCFLNFFKDKALVIPSPYMFTTPSSDTVFPYYKEMFDNKLQSFDQYYKSVLSTYYSHPNLSSISDKKVNNIDFFWDNGYFSGSDAKLLYAFLAHLNPATLIEIGVGNSTKIARKAIRDFELQTRIISVDPNPRANINNITDEHINAGVTQLDKDFFNKLQPNDILFIDGSHLCFSGTDVTHLFLNILPYLQPGVVVHVHDICLPWEYKRPFQVLHYNEQYVLAALIADCRTWDIVFPVYYCEKVGVLPSSGGASFWIKKNH